MKKIIFFMLLVFSTTTLVSADNLDDRIAEYKDVITLMRDNILANTPNHDLHLILNQDLITLKKIINILDRLPNAGQRIFDMRQWTNQTHTNTYSALANTLLDFNNPNINTFDAMDAMATHTDTLMTWSQDIHKIN